MIQVAMETISGKQAGELGYPSPARTALSVGLTDVVAFLDGRPDDIRVVEYAAARAWEHAARVTAVFVAPEPTLEPCETFARGAAIAGLIDHQADVLRSLAAERRTLVERIAHRHRVEAEWQLVASPEGAVMHARLGDVGVIARSDGANAQCGHRRLLEALIRTSGRPLIVLSPQGPSSRIRRVLVAWNGTREAARAAADAMPLLASAEAVELLSVDPAAGAAAPGALPGADIARHLARHGARVAVQHLSSNGEGVGHVLLAEARAFHADLIVMGGYGRSPLTERVFGGATHTVLRHGALPVLVSH